MKAKSGIVLAIIVTILNCSYGSSEKPETREDYEQKIKQQQEKIGTLELQILEQAKAITNLKSEVIELKKKIYSLKYETEPNDISKSKDKNIKITKLQAIVKNQQIEIERMRKLCRNTGVDPNSKPNNIQKLMTDEEQEAYEKRLADYRTFFRKKSPQIHKPQQYKQKELRIAKHKHIESKNTAVPLSVISGIRQKATSEWPDDYQMQQYTINQQLAAYRSLRKLSAPDVPEVVLRRIKQKATSEWSDDYQMQQYTINQQLTAYRSLSDNPYP